jgi:predicted N-acyltransferase
MDLGHKYESKDKEIEKFVKTKDHSFDFEEHSFQKYKQVLADINNKQKNEIIKNLSNYKYLKTFFKAFAITNNDKITSSIKLLSLFNEEYKNIKINYYDIDGNTKNILISNY